MNSVMPQFLPIRRISIMAMMLVCCLLMVTLGVRAEADDQSREEILLAEIKSFLNRFPVIRVPIMASSGNGHQSANAAVIQRLRQIGYTGQIEIAYDRTVARKLTYILPPFQGDKRGPQEFPELKLRFVPVDRNLPGSTLDEIPLGISGADDSGMPPETLRVKVLLNLQPFNWPEFHRIRFATHLPTGQWVAEEKRLNLKELGYKLSIPQPDDVSTFVANEMNHDFELQAKVPGLQYLLSQQGDFEFMPVYGHYIPKGWQLRKTQKALTIAQRTQPNAFRGGIVVPVFNEVRDPIQREFQSDIQRSGAPVVAMKIDDPNLPSAMSRLRAGEILIIFVGAVAKPVFEYVYSRATLPPLVEGVNNADLMRQLDRPYLISAPAKDSDLYQFQDSPEIENLPWDEAKAYQLALLAPKDLASQVGVPASAAAFILEGMMPQSALARLFHRFSANSEHKILSDKLIRGLLMTRKMIRQWETKYDISLLPRVCRDLFASPSAHERVH